VVDNMQYVRIKLKVIGFGRFNQTITRRTGICPLGRIGKQPRLCANSEGTNGSVSQYVKLALNVSPNNILISVADRLNKRTLGPKLAIPKVLPSYLRR